MVCCKLLRMENSTQHNPLSGIRKHFQSIAPQWVNEDVMGIVSGLKLTGGISSALASGLGSTQARFNPWRFASLGGFLSTQGLGVVYPEKLVSLQERDALDQLSLPHYILRKCSYAFDPQNHIREANGLMTIATGLLLIPAYRFERNTAFRPELSYCLTNAISGASMLFAKQPDTAWEISSAVQLAAVPIQVKGFWELMRNPSDIGAAWKGKWLFSSAMLFTTANLIGITLGGNEKGQNAPHRQIHSDGLVNEPLFEPNRARS